MWKVTQFPWLCHRQIYSELLNLICTRTPIKNNSCQNAVKLNLHQMKFNSSIVYSFELIKLFTKLLLQWLHLQFHKVDPTFPACGLALLFPSLFIFCQTLSWCGQLDWNAQPQNLTSNTNENSLVWSQCNNVSKDWLRKKFPALKELAGIHLCSLHELVDWQWQLYLNLLRHSAVAADTNRSLMIAVNASYITRDSRKSRQKIGK